MGRPTQRSTPRRNLRSHPGACRREERGRPSEPSLFTFIILLLWFFFAFLKHSSRRTAVTVAVKVWNALDSFPLLQSWIWLLSSERPVCIVVESRLCSRGRHFSRGRLGAIYHIRVNANRLRNSAATYGARALVESSSVVTHWSDCDVHRDWWRSNFNWLNHLLVVSYNCIPAKLCQCR